MKSTEVVAKTKEEAVSKALEELQLTHSQVSIELLGEESGGFLGLGGKRVRVRVAELAEGETDPAEVVRTLLKLMGVSFTLSVERQGEELNITVNSPEDDGLLIGRRGQTLDALRHLAQRITAARAGHNVVMNIDIGDYRARREASLCENADKVAAEVVKEERSASIEPMSSQDRRIIHLHLAERKDLHTYTVGGGARRRVVVAPGAEGSGDSRREHEERDEYRSEGRSRGRRGRGGSRGGGRGRDSRGRDDRNEHREEGNRERREEPRRNNAQPDVQPDVQPADSGGMKSAYDEIPDPGFQPSLLGSPSPARGGRGGRGGRVGRGGIGGQAKKVASEEELMQREEHRLRSTGGGGERSGSERGNENRSAGSGEPEGRRERPDGEGGERRPRRGRSRGRGRDGRGRDDRPRDDQSRSEQARDGQPRNDQPRSDQSRDGQPRNDQSRSDQSRDGQPRNDQSSDDQSRSDQSRSDQPRSDQSRGDGGREDRAARSEESRREDRGGRGDRGGRSDRGGRGGRGGRGDRGGRGRDGRDRDGRDRDGRARGDREEYDRHIAEFASDEPAATSLSDVKDLADSSQEKAFSSDLAKQILEIDAGGAQKKSTGRRRRR